MQVERSPYSSEYKYFNQQIKFEHTKILSGDY